MSITLNDFFDSNLTEPNTTGLDDVVLLMTSLSVFDDVTFLCVSRLFRLYIIFQVRNEFFRQFYPIIVSPV